MEKRDSLEQKFSSTISKCDICLQTYNRGDKQPVIICTMHHTICRKCLEALSNQKCPFCRQAINHRKVVLNNYIFELLPNHQKDNVQPNVRQEIINNNNSTNNNMANRQGIANVNSYHSVNNINNNNLNLLWNNNINNGLYRRSSSQEVEEYNYGYVPISREDLVANWLNFRDQHPPENLRGSVANYNYYALPNPIEHHPQPQPQRRLAADDHEPFYAQVDGQSCCSPCGCQNIDFHSFAPRRFLYVYIFFVQVPFMICNLYYSINAQQSQCMDIPHQSTAYVVRSWLLGAAIFEASFLALSLIFILFRLCNCISSQCLQFFQTILLVIIGLKIFTWALMELVIWYGGISQFCQGGFRSYALVLTILHWAVLIIVFAFISSRR